MRRVNTLPPVIFSCTDLNELGVALGLARDYVATRFLTRKLQHVALYRSRDLPDCAVSPNCRVALHLSDDPKLSVLVPIGAGLLGLRIGDAVFFAEDSNRREVVVDAVGMQFIDTKSRDERARKLRSNSRLPSLESILTVRSDNHA